jgi:hypothetical protein
MELYVLVFRSQKLAYLRLVLWPNLSHFEQVWPNRSRVLYSVRAYLAWS